MASICLLREEGYTVKYSLSPKEILKRSPREFLYRVTIQTLSIKCTGKYSPSSTGSKFYSTLPVELDLYVNILPI